MYAIKTLGVAGRLGIASVAACRRQTAIIHAEAFFVFQDRNVSAERTFPGTVEFQDGFGRLRRMQLQIFLRTVEKDVVAR